MKKITLGQFTPYIIPGPNDNEQMCGADFGVIRAGYTALPLEAKKSIDDLGADEAHSLLAAQVLSSKVRPLLNAARGFKYVSRGMILS